MRVSRGVGRRECKGLLVLDDGAWCCWLWLGGLEVGVCEVGGCLGMLLPLRLMGAEEEEVEGIMSE